MTCDTAYSQFCCRIVSSRSDMTQSDEAMIKYLEQQCLLSELQDMVTDLSPDVDHGLDQPGFSKTLGMQQQADVLASLSKHLQAAALAQQLQLPEAGVQHFNTSHDDNVQGECGMPRHTCCA